MSTNLTPAQLRYLEEIRRDGERTYNGRAYHILEVLENQGLIEVEWFIGDTFKERHRAKWRKEQEA